MALTTHPLDVDSHGDGSGLMALHRVAASLHETLLAALQQHTEKQP